MWKDLSHTLYLYVFIALVCIPCFYYLSIFLDYNSAPTVTYYVIRLAEEFCTSYVGDFLFLGINKQE